jgi:hypothetical protein
METITKGTKLELTLGGTTRTYEVKWIENGIYTLFNKYTFSLHVDFDFILEHLTTIKN